jgi:flagellar hook assembly protein FlgD
VWLTVEAGTAGVQRLDVMDVQGRTVRQLSQGWYESGTRQVRWDGRDASGVRAPAGVYLVTLQAGDRSTRTRVTLLK